jgi:hypothetical protein
VRAAMGWLWLFPLVLVGLASFQHMSLFLKLLLHGHVAKLLFFELVVLFLSFGF